MNRNKYEYRVAYKKIPEIKNKVFKTLATAIIHAGAVGIDSNIIDKKGYIHASYKAGEGLTLYMTPQHNAPEGSNPTDALGQGDE